MIGHLITIRPSRASPLGWSPHHHSAVPCIATRLVTSSPLGRLTRLQTAKSFYILLFSSSRVFHNSHIRFTRRPRHQVYLYARLLIFTYLLSTGYVTPKSNFHFFAYIIYEHQVSFFISSLRRSSGAATQSKHYTSVLFELVSQ